MSAETGRGWITGAAVVVAATLALVLAAAIGMGVGNASGRALTFEVPASSLVGLPDTTADLTGATLAHSGTVRVEIADPTSTQAAWAALVWLPVTLLGAAVLALVLYLVVLARRGAAFTGRVVGVLRTVGLLVLLGGPLTQLLAALGQQRLADTVVAAGGDLALTMSVDWLIGGVCVLALAEVIRRGQALREELDEVI